MLFCQHFNKSKLCSIGILILIYLSDFKNRLLTTGDVSAMAQSDFKMVNVSKIYNEYQEALKKNSFSANILIKANCAALVS